MINQPDTVFVITFNLFDRAPWNLERLSLALYRKKILAEGIGQLNVLVVQARRAFDLVIAELENAFALLFLVIQRAYDLGRYVVFVHLYQQVENAEPLLSILFGGCVKLERFQVFQGYAEAILKVTTRVSGTDFYSTRVVLDRSGLLDGVTRCDVLKTDLLPLLKALFVIGVGYKHLIVAVVELYPLLVEV